VADLFPDAELGEMINDGLVMSFVANAPITKGKVVKFVAVANDLPKVDVAGAGDKGVGVALKTVVAGESTPVGMANAVLKVTGSGAISAGAAVKAGANGVVAAAIRAIPSGATAVTSNAAQPNIDAGYAFATAFQTFADGDTGLIQVGGMP